MDILSKITKIPFMYVVYAIVVCILLASIIYVYKYYVAPKIGSTFPDNNEFATGGDGSSGGDGDGSSGYAEITMFYVDWCPHCKKSKPAFDEFTQKYNGKTINGFVVKVRSVNCTNEEDPNVKSVHEKYNIEGYPTILLSKNGEIINFNANPDMETLEQFVNEVLS